MSTCKAIDKITVEFEDGEIVGIGPGSTEQILFAIYRGDDISQVINGTLYDLVKLCWAMLRVGVGQESRRSEFSPESINGLFLDPLLPRYLLTPPHRRNILDSHTLVFHPS